MMPEYTFIPKTCQEILENAISEYTFIQKTCLEILQELLAQNPDLDVFINFEKDEEPTLDVEEDDEEGYYWLEE